MVLPCDLFFLFLLSLRKVLITVENFQNTRVHTITVKNKDLFWVKIVDVQNGLGLKCMCSLIKTKICGIFGMNDLYTKIYEI